MEWTDDGVVLSTRRHGESGLIVMLLARRHGRHAGLARGHKLRAALQPGTLVDNGGDFDRIAQTVIDV